MRALRWVKATSAYFPQHSSIGFGVKACGRLTHPTFGFGTGKTNNYGFAGGFYLVGSWANTILRISVTSALSSAVLIFSLTAMMLMLFLVNSDWTLTPFSKFRLNQSSQPTTMVSLGQTRVIILFQAGRDMDPLVVSSAKICSSRTPNSWSMCSWVSKFRVAPSVLLTLAYP